MASHDLDAVEFVRVEPADEELIAPAAPNVPVDDVRAYAGWSAAEEDQLQMWALVGTSIEGNRMTRRCPDCKGDKRVTCGKCQGGGKVACTWCSGSGYQGCSNCGGSGGRMVTRTSTNADGTNATVTESESCMSCGGSGRSRCMPCLGSGRETCHTCGGAGDVTCETCSPEGTVDYFMRRSFVESGVGTYIQRVTLPGYPEPIPLSEGHVQLQPREASTPYDVAADRAELEQRGITTPDARLFFVRKAVVTMSRIADPGTGDLLATYIDGEPDPVLTIHRTAQDPDWSSDRQRGKAWAAFMLYTLAPLVLLLFVVLHLSLIGVGAALLIVVAATVLCKNPVQAFRMTFLDVRCTRHSRSATMRCAGCRQDLCHECLQPSPRCPQCRQVASTAITHLIEDGQWVPANGG